MPADIERLVIVPVIHTDNESTDRVRRVIREVRPEVVAVELDVDRYSHMVSAAGDVTAMPPAGGDPVTDLMWQLATLEESIGVATGAGVGNEMLAAIEEGRAVGAKVALVDRPIAETMRELERQVSLEEVYTFLDMAASAAQELGNCDAHEVVGELKTEDGVESVLKEFREQFPGMYAVLLEGRDRYVARALRQVLGDTTGKVVAVLGAGHVAGVRRALEEMCSGDHGG